jgi:Ca-activated chloride channel family protein
MSASLFAVEFLERQRLWWIMVVALLGVAYVFVLVWRKRATVRFTQVELLDKIAPSRPGWRRHVVAALQLAGLTAGVVAIARPVSVSTERTESEGRILVLFDVSLSMEATDVDPTRLDAAKEAAGAFVAQVDPDVEVGLVSFAGTVSVDVRPTLDRTSVEDAIEGLELDESTAIGDALATGTNLLVDLAGGATDDAAGGGAGGTDDADATSDDDVAPGAIVLLTDGETTVGRPTEDGARVAADAGVPVFSIAFGTDAGTIQDPETGETIPVPVFPEPLEDVAEVTGGAAFEAATETELADVYAGIRDVLGETLGEEIETVNELTWEWAAAALVLLAAAWALSLWWLRGLV